MERKKEMKAGKIERRKERKKKRRKERRIEEISKGKASEKERDRVEMRKQLL